MAKLTRLTGKLFGETATATGDNPQIGQFGSGLAGTYVGTTDVSTIQNLAAWSNGFIGCVTPDTQYPPLPEMTGFGKVLSYQENYLLQQGIAEWDSATTYYTNGYCSYNGVIYKSLTDNNLNNNPSLSTANWVEYTPSGLNNLANKDLSNLSATGDARLHALKGYFDNGELLTDSEGLADVTNYAHNNYNSTPFTPTGSPTNVDGLASGFSTSDYYSVSLTTTISTSDTFEFDIKFTTPASFGGTQTIWAIGNNYRAYQGGSGYLYCLFWGQSTGFQMTANTTYQVKFIYDGSNIYAKYKKDTDTTWSTANTTAISSGTTQTNPTITIGSQGSSNAFNGSIDLKYFAVTVNGSLVVSGNVTGIDTIKPDDYTVVGSPTISADGVASGFNGASDSKAGIKILPDLSSANLKKLVIECDLNYVSTNLSQPTFWFYPSSSSNTRIMYFSVNANKGVTTALYDLGNTATSNIFTTDGEYHIKYETDLTSYYKVYVNDTLYNSNTFETTGTKTVGKITLGYTEVEAISWQGSIDLNAFKIYVDGNLVYQPCLKIPYALSKTGSKVVDGVYLDRVIDCYNYEGYAPYYTLNEVNGNFTLPMGEIYGMHVNKSNLQEVQCVVETYVNGTSWYRVWSDGWCEQGGYNVENVTINFLKTFSDTNYCITGMAPQSAGNYVVCYDSKTASSIMLRIGSDTTGTSYITWQACGYIN